MPYITRVDHPPAADGRLALPRAPVQGRRARAARRSPSTPATARSSSAVIQALRHRHLPRGRLRIAGRGSGRPQPGLGLPAA
ncbi:MAG: hypothetical protein M0C28_43270 [Candidatus Moduliflexus flocculans]|nr:hypothetical protein [Candidatus Moduliflexus flocculans]